MPAARSTASDSTSCQSFTLTGTGVIVQPALSSSPASANSLRMMMMYRTIMMMPNTIQPLQFITPSAHSTTFHTISAAAAPHFASKPAFCRSAFRPLHRQTTCASTITRLNNVSTTAAVVPVSTSA